MHCSTECPGLEYLQYYVTLFHDCVLILADSKLKLLRYLANGTRKDVTSRKLVLFHY